MIDKIKEFESRKAYSRPYLKNNRTKKEAAADIALESMLREALVDEVPRRNYHEQVVEPCTDKIFGEFGR